MKLWPHLLESTPQLKADNTSLAKPINWCQRSRQWPRHMARLGWWLAGLSLVVWGADIRASDELAVPSCNDAPKDTVDAAQSGAGGGADVGPTTEPEGSIADALTSGDSDALLKSLLWPVTPTTFAETLLEECPHHWKRGKEYNAGIVDEFNPEDPQAVREFVASCVSVDMKNVSQAGGLLQAFEDVTFASDGQYVGNEKLPHWPSLDRSDLEAYFETDVSVVLNSVHYRAKGVFALSVLLEKALGYAVSINMYHTPVPGKAFSLHYDSTEVIILQLAGSKRWTVAQSLVPLPRSDDVHLDLGKRTSVPLRIQMEVTLEPGDMLYIPRGTLHFAVNEADTETLDMSEASTHLTLAVYVQFWQTVEAALHVLLMRMWLAELAPESVPQSVFDAMDEIIDVARNPDTGGTFSLPASLLLHAAIRNAGNGRSGVLRRAALVSGKGNLTATAAVLTTLCESPPTLSEIMEEMMMWDSAPDSTITGLGSIYSVQRDLVDLTLDTPAKTWKRLVTVFEDLAYEDDDEYSDGGEGDVVKGSRTGGRGASDYYDESVGVGDAYYIDSEGSASDDDDDGTESPDLDQEYALPRAKKRLAEAALSRAWAAFCEETTSSEPETVWAPVFAHMRAVHSARREPWIRHMKQGLRAHKIDVDPADWLGSNE